MMVRRLHRLLAYAAPLVLSGMALRCAESNFNLADESRLPVWFTLPEGQTRADVILTMYYYGQQAELVLRGRSGRVIAKVTGDVRSTDGAIHLPASSGTGFDDRSFEVITVGGVAEVFEFRPGVVQGFRTAILYVCDDPEVRRRLGVRMRGESRALQ